MTSWLEKSQPVPAREDAPVDRALMTTFLENVPDLVYFKDRDSRFIAVSRSKAARHDLDPEEMTGKSDADFFSTEHAQWAMVDEENIMSTGEPILGKLEHIAWPDGRRTWSNTSKLPLRDDDGAIIGTFGVTRDVTQEQEMQLELEKAKRSLVDTSRSAGMAEVATGVLHNVGNVLTSLNVSASVIATSLHQSKAGSLGKLSGLLEEHRGDLGRFIAEDPKGRRVPEFLESLARHALAERDHLLDELASLQENIDHIKEIVTMQQAYATTVGLIEPLDASLLMEDAARMNAGALLRHQVKVLREFDAAPAVLAEKSKVLQILVNLIRNAKYACDEGGTAKVVTLRVQAVTPTAGPAVETPGESSAPPAAAPRVRFVVQDDGVGIPPENLSRIFEHGFTTRRDGHGFGLHSAANAAKEMNGSLTVHSAGRGHGATFTLELPSAPEGSIPANAYCVVPR